MPRGVGVEPDIPAGPCLDDPPMSGIRAVVPAFVIQVDECPYFPAFMEPAGGVIVHCGV